MTIHQKLYRVPHQPGYFIQSQIIYDYSVHTYLHPNNQQKCMSDLYKPELSITKSINTYNITILNTRS